MTKRRKSLTRAQKPRTPLSWLRASTIPDKRKQANKLACRPNRKDNT